MANVSHWLTSRQVEFRKEIEILEFLIFQHPNSASMTSSEPDSLLDGKIVCYWVKFFVSLTRWWAGIKKAKVTWLLRFSTRSAAHKNVANCVSLTALIGGSVLGVVCVANLLRREESRNAAKCVAMFFSRTCRGVVGTAHSGDHFWFSAARSSRYNLAMDCWTLCRD